MCWSDLSWGSVPEWLQFAAILGTGASAVFVANRQLNAYNAALKSANDNERFRNSMRAFQDMRNSTDLMGTTTSPLNAVLKVSQVARDANEVRRFKSFPERERRADPSAANDCKWYGEINSSIAIALSFFLDLGMLLDRKLVDFDYVIPKSVGYIVRLDDAINVLEPPSLELHAFNRFVALARNYGQKGRVPG